MPEDTQKQVKDFISFFGGDIAVAQRALSEYTNPSYRITPAAKIAPGTKAIITAQNVSKSYTIGKRSILALKNIHLTIYQSEFVAITGPSGSGKSTLLHLLGCLDTPSEGTVLIGDKNTSKLNDASLSRLRGKTIGFIFQSFYLQPFLKLNANVAVPAMFTKKSKKQIDTTVSLLLKNVGLLEQSTHYPKELSGGQTQRAAIARALVNTPEILLADEPTGNLDSANSQSIVNLFQSIRTTLGTTIVIVTHNPDIARQADRIIHLNDGEVQ